MKGCDAQGAGNAPESASPGEGFRSILKSSAVIGASSLVNIVFSALRTKAMALMLGPAGVGLMGAFWMILELARSVAQLGLASSGVRQIAEASASSDERRVAVTNLVLNRITLACAVLGAVALAVFSDVISQWTFGTAKYGNSVALLSLALFVSVLAGAYSALLQGVRRIADQARITVYAALIGAALTVGIVYFAGEQGIVPALIAAASISLGLSWWYARKVPTIPVALQAGDTNREAALLLKLGLAFMASGLLAMGVAYLVRTFVLRTLGLEAAGMYQAAWAVAGLYVGIALQALGTDFYPRLVGVAHDHPACNATVNEQTQASLLLAAPGVIATISFAPLAIYLFYSAEFAGAVELLRWMCLGMALRVITWPVGYIIVAKNRQVVFFLVEALWAAFSVAAAWWCLRTFGLDGTGIAFMLSYVFHAFVVYPAARQMTGFRWSAANLRLGSWFILSIVAAFAFQRALPAGAALAAGAALTMASLWYCVRTLLRLSASDKGWPGIRRLLRRR
jgi:enterobacterial common antigen flippase